VREVELDERNLQSSPLQASAYRNHLPHHWMQRQMLVSAMIPVELGIEIGREV
jgi:hypothetical protein